MAARRRRTTLRGRPAGKRAVGRNDTLVSAYMLDHAVDAILKRVRLDRTYDIPYLSGYSGDGRTIYIDRHLPRSFLTRGRRVRVDPFLILHEAVEKALLHKLHLVYQHAHQIALRAEEAAVRAAGVSWREYDRFMQRHVKEADDERLSRIPPNLDIKPYRDESDWQLLKSMQRVIRRERAARRQPGGGS
ncbi:MAG: hypothetical protein PHU85_09860 [Phycisphaerae bacterium]|nr:hypothetical protein [Phycisphaerae bacterium]